MKMAGVLRELELQMIRSRVKSSIANAKAEGIKIGRKLTTKEDIPLWVLQALPRLRNQEDERQRADEGRN